MYPEEYKINIIERRLSLSLKAKSPEETNDIEMEDSNVTDKLELRFLKFPVRR